MLDTITANKGYLKRFVTHIRAFIPAHNSLRSAIQKFHLFCSSPDKITHELLIIARELIGSDEPWRIENGQTILLALNSICHLELFGIRHIYKQDHSKCPIFPIIDEQTKVILVALNSVDH